MKNRNIIFSIFLYIAVIVFILTLSISLPIYIRSFYYMHIEAYDLEEKSGFTEDEIIEAYDETLDYLSLKTSVFSCGVMKFSEDGADHFKDCRYLFTLNLCALISSALIIFLISAATKLGKLPPPRLFNSPPQLLAGFSALFLTVALAASVLINPENAFVVFHKIFFPGKDNWIFSVSRDEIISVLPQQFFFNCAILIGASILVLSTLFILSSFIKQKKK